MTTKPLITVADGEASVFYGDALIVDYDEWKEAKLDRRHEIINEIQAAGYTCVVWTENNYMSIQVFAPSAADEFAARLPQEASYVIYSALGARAAYATASATAKDDQR